MINAYYFEILAFIVALICYSKLKASYMVYFIPFLLFTIICEVGSDFIYSNYQIKTEWIYNILNPVTTLFYGYIFCSLIRNRKLKSVFFWGALLYIVINIYVLSQIEGFSILLILLSSIILVTLSCYYFYRCLLDDVDLTAFYIKSGLWFAAGILIFYSGISIVFALVDYIRAHHLTMFGVSLYKFVPRTLSIILYGCFSIAFLLWRKPQKVY